MLHRELCHVNEILFSMTNPVDYLPRRQRQRQSRSMKRQQERLQAASYRQQLDDALQKGAWPTLDGLMTEIGKLSYRVRNLICVQELIPDSRDETRHDEPTERILDLTMYKAVRHMVGKVSGVRWEK